MLIAEKAGSDDGGMSLSVRDGAWRLMSRRFALEVSFLTEVPVAIAVSGWFHRGLLDILASASEFNELPVRQQEEKAVKMLTLHLPQKVRHCVHVFAIK